MNVTNPEELKKVVEEEVTPLTEEMQQLKTMAATNANSIMNLNLDEMPERQGVLTAIETFGIQTMKTAAEKNALLQVSVAKLSQGGNEGSVVAKGLSDLQIQMKELDPSGINFSNDSFLGKIFNPLKSYFNKFKKADTIIAEIVEMLEKGKQQLKDDNVTLTIEQQQLRDLTKILKREIQLAVFMDETLQQKIAEAKTKPENAEKVKFVEEEILFPLRQRIMDMQEMVTVNQHGYITFELTIRNNKELIRGVDRANTVSVSALRIAVTAAQALANQKLVLDRINALNKTTEHFITNVGKMLKEQGTEIQKRSMETNISPEVLKQAFQDSFEALDSISTYKQQALPQMQSTIAQFKQMAEEGEKRIEKLEKGKNLLTF